MSDDELYKYWMIYVHPHYVSDIFGARVLESAEMNLQLYAYTDNKKFMKHFLQIHNKNKFICRKVKLTRKEVNELTAHNQNKIIREIKLHGQDKTTMRRDSKLFYITEREFMNAENFSYKMILTMSKSELCGKIHITTLKDKYIGALADLGFMKHVKMLESNDMIETFNEPDMIQAFIIANYDAIV